MNARKLEAKARATAKVLMELISENYPESEFDFVLAPGEETCWRLEVRTSAKSSYEVLDLVRDDISRVLREENFSIYVTVGSLKAAASAR